MAYLERAKELRAPPPVGSPFSVPLPNSELQGRSAVYRHWRSQDGLLQSLDDDVSLYTAKECVPEGWGLSYWVVED